MLVTNTTARSLRAGDIVDIHHTFVVITQLLSAVLALYWRVHGYGW